MSDTALVPAAPVPQAVTPEAFLQASMSAAIERNVAPETIERMMALYERMKAQEAKHAYDAAMAEFQGRCPIIKKTKQVPDRNGNIAYKYAPLESIVAQTRELIGKCGFSYTVETGKGVDGVDGVTVTAKHTAGHSEHSFFPLKLGTKTGIMSDTQQMAAAYTFAKRYAFCNLFGILTGDEDNDGGTQQWHDERALDRNARIEDDVAGQRRFAGTTAQPQQNATPLDAPAPSPDVKPQVELGEPTEVEFDAVRFDAELKPGKTVIYTMDKLGKPKRGAVVIYPGPLDVPLDRSLPMRCKATLRSTNRTHGATSDVAWIVDRGADNALLLEILPA